MASIEIDGVNGVIKNTTSDADIFIKGNDGGSEITALTFDISAAGAATFNSSVAMTSFAATAASTITTADNTDTLTLISTDTDSAIGPNLNLYRNAGNGADADNLATVAFAGNDDAGNATDFYRITAQIEDASNGSEDVYVHHRSMVAGTEQLRMSLYQAEAVFNDGSADIDFRVESNGNTHMLFVDGGNNRVGVFSEPDLGSGLHIRTADSSASVNGDGDELVIEHSGNAGLSILTGTSNVGGIFFGDSGDNDIGGILYNHANNDLTITAEAAEAMRFDGKVISTGGETAADVSGGGICLNQGVADDQILSFKNSDIAHGMTGVKETDTYGTWEQQNGTNGGLRTIGLTADKIAQGIFGYYTNSDEAESTGAEGAVAVEAHKKSGAGTAGPGGDDNLFIVRALANTQFIVKGDGELFSNQSATVGTFDAYEDAQLVRAVDLNHMQGVINSKFDKFVQYNKDDLQKAKLIGTDADGNATPFVNITGMSRLHNGAIWQQYEKHQRLAEAVYEMAKETLGKDKADAILEKHDIKLLN
jgi:hypothetical protein